MNKLKLSTSLLLMTLAFSAILATTLSSFAAETEPQKNPAFVEGLAAFNQADYPLARARLTTALKANPADIETLRVLGLTQYKLQENKEALETLQKVLDQNPNDARAQYAMGVVNLARAGEVSVLRVRKYLTTSIEHFEKAIALDPQHGLAQYYLMQVVLNAPDLFGGDEERGAELSAMLATTDPFLHKIGNARTAIKEENWADAETILLDADKLNPDHSAAAYSLAELYLLTEDYEKSVRYGEKFLAIDKKWDETTEIAGFYILARAYKGTGDKEQSRLYYKKAIDQTKNKKYAKGLEEELEELDKETSKK